MVDWDVPRTPVSALLLTRLAGERGMSTVDALAGTGLRYEDLVRPHAEVSARQELAVVDNLVAEFGPDSGLGLEAGRRYHLTSYGIWGFMLISSPTPRRAVAAALRYIDLTYAFCRITAREHGTEFQLALDAESVPVHLRRFVLEREAAAIRTMQQEAFPAAFTLNRVSCAFPRHPAAESVFAAPARFDTAETVLTYDGTVLDAPMPQADEHATAMATAQCRELLQRRLSRAGVSGRARDLLLTRLSDPPDAAEVAASMNLSLRTLQRRLAADGTSIRRLLDEVREQLAEELLLLDDLPVAEVAHRLGYVEVSSFSQAFHRWKGVGPRVWRRRNR